MADYRTIKAEPLTNAIRAIVKAGGSTDREAELVSTNLVEANLKRPRLARRRHDPALCPERRSTGGLAVNAHVKIVLDTGPLLTLDGLTGYGQVIGHEAMELAAERAKQQRRLRRRPLQLAPHRPHRPLGRAVHRPRAGLDPLRQRDLAPDRRAVGRQRCAPRHQPVLRRHPAPGKDPIVLDFATSRIAQGKTRVAYNKGVELEPGTIIDNEGKPTTNPRYTVIPPHGAILPFGEHKGSGLALVCEILGGALSGGQAGQGPVRRQAQRPQRHALDRHRPGQARHRRKPRARGRELRRLAHRLAAGRRRRQGQDRRRARARDARRSAWPKASRSIRPPGRRFWKPGRSSGWIRPRSRRSRAKPSQPVSSRHRPGP